MQSKLYYWFHFKYVKYWKCTGRGDNDRILKTKRLQLWIFFTSECLSCLFFFFSSKGNALSVNTILLPKIVKRKSCSFRFKRTRGIKILASLLKLHFFILEQHTPPVVCYYFESQTLSKYSQKHPRNCLWGEIILSRLRFPNLIVKFKRRATPGPPP